MHDPMTVAFSIKWPFVTDHIGTYLIRPTLITIWHKDPERGGSDDSCGWACPKPSKLQRERLGYLAGWEAREPWFRAHRGKSLEDPVALEVLCRGALLQTARWMRVPLPYAKACEMAAILVQNPSDNLRGSFALLPGWHTNSEQDTEYWRTECAENLFLSLAAQILRGRRHWWQHPRWHLHHWRIQVHPLQAFKRWAFSRCCKCGGRFRWGESPVGYSWHGLGPTWHGEDHVAHMACDPAAQPVADAVEAL